MIMPYVAANFKTHNFYRLQFHLIVGKLDDKYLDNGETPVTTTIHSLVICRILKNKMLRHFGNFNMGINGKF